MRVLAVAVMAVCTASAWAAEGEPAAAVAGPSLAVGTHVAVTIHSGRVLRGRLDARTNAQAIWLVAEAEGMTVGSRIEACDIAKIETSEPVTLPPEIMRFDDWRYGPSGHRVPGAWGHPGLPHRHTVPFVPHHSGGAAAPRGLQPVPAPRGAERGTDASRAVRSLDVFARAANWNSDPQPDGLRVYVVPRSSHGELVPATGSVSVVLAVYRGDWRSPVDRFLVEERWSQPVTAADFGPHGAVLELPYRRIKPESDRDLLPVGVLSVRLGLPGVGTFDARLDDVELRSLAFTRDLRLHGTSNADADR